jgi:cytochrome c553
MSHAQRLSNALFLALVSLSTAAACTTGPTLAASATCKSGQHWVGGDDGSPEMRPGTDCIACHTSRAEGPDYSVAGTVYPSNASTDTNDCTGVAGATVEITDKNGKLWTMQSNAVGNFFLKSSTGKPALPYTARITWNGKTREMLSPQMVTACNSCHTPTGLNAAPGRILLPE